MAKMLKGKKRIFQKCSAKGKYRIRITCDKKQTKVQLSLIRKMNVALHELDDFSPFDVFAYDSLVRLLRYYIKDCFVLNSFNPLNNRRNLVLDYDGSKMDDVEKIEVWVKNKSNMCNPLKLK